jgi:Carboxypeptidase regulatory-like domain
MKKTSLLVLFAFSLVSTAIFAQVKPPPPTPTPRPSVPKTVIERGTEITISEGVGRGSGSGRGTGYSDEEDDDGKLTGATIRGKVVYEDTGRPLRFVAIGFVKTGEENNTYSTKFVKTDENGDFVIKNVKAGAFLPVIKADGILNPTSYTNQIRQSDKKAEIENLFEKTEVAGLGEFQVLIRAKRGGSITGKVNYSDGEVAVGVKVEALINKNNRFQATSYGDFSVGTATTDDRGFYRFAGLPEGKYIVRVTEPVSHKETKAPLWETTRGSYGQESQMLVTYYPDSEKSDKATQLDVGIGQEQSDINFNLPERKLFRVAGKIIGKSNQQPLKDFKITLFKMNNFDEKIGNSGPASTVTTDSTGSWALRSLPKGKYVVSIEKGYVYKSAKETQTEKEIIYSNMSKTIEITDKDMSDLVFELPSESIISGLILTEDGKNLPAYVGVFALSDDGKNGGNSENAYREKGLTDEQNKQTPFKIGKLTAGKYKLKIAGNRDYYVKSVKLNGSEVANSFIEVKEGEELKNIQIVLSNQTGTLKGKVDGYDSKERGFVVLTNPNTKYGDADTNSDSRGAAVMPNGDFEIKAKDGEYAVLLITENSRPKTEEEGKEWFNNLIKNAPKVQIKLGEVSNITLKMPNN